MVTSFMVETQTIEGYFVVYFEVAGPSSFRDFTKDHFVTVKSAAVEVA